MGMEDFRATKTKPGGAGRGAWGGGGGGRLGKAPEIPMPGRQNEFESQVSLVQVEDVY